MRIDAPLFLLALGSLAARPSVVSCENVYYQPATGYFLCPGANMVCNVIGCEEDGGNCSVVMAGFRQLNGGDRLVYTSTRENASLSITGGEGTKIDCDASCECQSIIANTGCSVPIDTEYDDPFEKGISNAMGETTTANIDDNSSSTPKLVSLYYGRSVLLAVVTLMFML